MFKATNPSNKLEDVNTIKQFCDTVNANQGGEAAVVACRLLAHKIQSPQDREAIQALAVLEACVKSCGPTFHAEVGKFKFLNEMIKLVSPKFLADRTPEHIKKKVIELLYLWSTKELKGETKICEAYSMLKKQGIVQEDPIHVGDAVFASALPPRRSAPLSDEESQRLRRLLQSKNPDDLQMANRIIKGMVQEDERKMDALTKRATELTMVNNNAKLLNEMLDHFDKSSSGSEEKQLLQELFQSCEKMQPKLFRLAAETEDDDESSLAKILQASDDINKVIDRYKMVVVQGKPDIVRPSSASLQSDQLLNLEESATALADEDLLGETHPSSALNCFAIVIFFSGLVSSSVATAEDKSETATPPQASKSGTMDLLDDDSIEPPSEDVMPIIPVASAATSNTSSIPTQPPPDEMAKRSKGLEELDFLGETLLKQHLPGRRSPQFVKKKEEKLSLNSLQQKQREKDLVQTLPTNGTVPATTPTLTEDQPCVLAKPAPTIANATKEEVRLADLDIPLSSIKPGSTPPLTLQESSDGVSIVLHFGSESPRQHVSAIVVTVISKLPEAISDYELKAVVPKGCKVKILPATTTSLPGHNPFVPPSAITQVMLVANPAKIDVSLKYIVSYLVDGEPQTEMGQVEKLPI